MSAWDDEYGRGGIPSSIRQGPSGVLVWALGNWKFLTGSERPTSALDVGCGTGRNASFLAELGIDAFGFDSSATAIAMARERARSGSFRASLAFQEHDLRTGLPMSDSSCDLVLDIFVYKHLVDPGERAEYRHDLRRVLRDGGRLLLSLAGKDDGYYRACPLETVAGNPITVFDPAAKIGSVLYDINNLLFELGDVFDLEMYWAKHKEGIMHGQTYHRSTIATIWRLK